MFAGTVSSGPVVSWTTMSKELVPVLPDSSVAEQVTVVVPRAKVSPEARSQVTGRSPSMLSVAETPL